MDRLSKINSAVNSITELDFDLRVSIAHRLLMKLEEKKDITRWAFWDRVSVKEHAEELSEKNLSEKQVDALMANLNEGWNKLDSSLRDTDSFTKSVSNALKSSLDK